MKTLISVVIIFVIGLFGGTSDTESIICETAPLSEYGMTGHDDEILCVNIIDSEDTMRLRNIHYMVDIKKNDILKIDIKENGLISDIEIIGKRTSSQYKK